MKFERFNINPGNSKPRDWEVRAVALALDLTWQEAMMELAKTACETYHLPTSMITVDVLLKSKGWTKVKADGRQIGQYNMNGTHIVVLKFKKMEIVSCVKDGILKDVVDLRSLNTLYFYNPPKA